MTGLDTPIEGPLSNVCHEVRRCDMRDAIEMAVRSFQSISKAPKGNGIGATGSKNTRAY